MTTGRDPMTSSGSTGTEYSSGTGLDAGGTAGTSTRPMVGVMDSPSDTGSDDRLGQAAGGIADRVGGTISEQANVRTDDQLTKAGDVLEQVAGAVRKSGEQLRAEQPQIAGFADTAANEVEKAARFLRDADLDKIIHEAETFARRQPAVFVGAALTLGFLASRFLKASPSSQGSGQYRGSTGSGYGSSGYVYGGYPSTSYDSTTGMQATQEHGYERA